MLFPVDRAKGIHQQGHVENPEVRDLEWRRKGEARRKQKQHRINNWWWVGQGNKWTAFEEWVCGDRS